MSCDDDTIDRAADFAFAELERVGEIEQLPRPLQVVVIIYSAQGIIDNGGFQYFFESDFEGQPPYSRFVDAYREIGAEAEADALDAIVKLFPFAEPHKHHELRNEFLARFQDEDGHRPDSPFETLDIICGSAEVVPRLAKFVERHAEFFSPRTPK